MQVERRQITTVPILSHSCSTSSRDHSRASTYYVFRLLLYYAQHKTRQRSEEHTSELQSLMRISYAVFCLKKKKHIKSPTYTLQQITTNSRKLKDTRHRDTTPKTLP